MAAVEAPDVRRAVPRSAVASSVLCRGVLTAGVGALVKVQPPDCMVEVMLQLAYMVPAELYRWASDEMLAERRQMLAEIGGGRTGQSCSTSSSLQKSVPL